MSIFQKQKEKQKPKNRQPVFVTVLSKTGKVLEPTNRCGHIRLLLKEKKAKVVRTKPFTVQLLYDCPEVVQGEILGIDPGRTNIGLSTVKEDGTCTGRFKVVTRNKDIVKLMRARALSRRKHRDMGRRDRRQRRAIKNTTFHKSRIIRRILPGCKKPVVCHEIKNKEARFNNRKRPAGWHTPTANQLLETHLNLVNKMIKIRPISGISVEMNKFAFMRLQAKTDGTPLENIDYTQGPLYGEKDLHSAVYKQQDGKCLFCKKAGIGHYHHIVPRKEGGSDTIANLTGLCLDCHDTVHASSEAKDKLKQKKAGLCKQFAGTSVLNQIMPDLVKKLAEQHPDIKITVTTGYETQKFRDEHNLSKDHDIDAFCIACSALETKDMTIAKLDVKTQMIKQYRRQDRQCCHKEMHNRNYYLDGKKIATNRHKAKDQKTKSLEEVRPGLTKEQLSKLTVQEHPKQYKNRNRVMPGAVMQFTQKLTKK